MSARQNWLNLTFIVEIENLPFSVTTVPGVTCGTRETHFDTALKGNTLVYWQG